MENSKVPVLSVDAPSSWSIEDGPPASGPGAKFHPATLISLTAPKPLVKHFAGTHFVGGRYTFLFLQSYNFLRIVGSSNRFIPQSVAEKYDLDIPDYEGVDQIAEVSGTGMEGKKQDIVGLAERQG